MSVSHSDRSQQNRLPQGGRIDRGTRLQFSFNGQQMAGFAGDTLASALLANGVSIVGRSFKYGRPRGIMCAGVEEPNAIMQIGSTEATQIPNIKATEQVLYEGLVSRSVNGWPNVEHDAMEWLGRLGGSVMAPGFYYKTFMWPRFGWKAYEHFIRKAAGLGQSPRLPDPDRYEHLHHHVDVCVVGAGPAGLVAALSASRSGARVMLADEGVEPGGTLLYSTDTLNGEPPLRWVAEVMAELQANDKVICLQRATVNGLHDHNFLTVVEKCTDHLAEQTPAASGVRQRLHKVRAGAVVLCTGAHERPLVYGNNDVPGCMVGSAVTQYLRRFAVAPGRRLVVCTCNDSAYHAAFEWADAGREVVAIVDARAEPDGSVTAMAKERGITVLAGSAVIEARGRRRVNAAAVASVNARADKVTGAARLLECDLIASSGGWSPVVHLSCHTGSRPVWRTDIAGFVPGDTHERRWFAGAVSGSQTLQDGLQSALIAAQQASASAGFALPPDAVVLPEVPGSNASAGKALALFHVPHHKPTSRAPKQFVDMQNDVTAAGIEMAVREGFESIEHVKRYTALGFGTDQGKTGNINGMAVVARALGRSIRDTGTTVFRPNYSPVSFGVVAGAHVGELFDPQRYTPIHPWHVEQGARFENVGQWKRPWYYPQSGESMAEAIAREQLAVRNAVGLLDASTLGKIDIQGRDAREFLDRVYTNAWQTLKPGHCKYGLMCGEDGMVMDDGVTACLADNHFLMTTTTGGAAHVLSWLEIYHQTEWPELDVFFTSVTDHWSTMALAGPQARKVLGPLTETSLEPEQFGFMQWREATVAGVRARLFRISFTGELSYEISVPSHQAMHVWQALMDAGQAYGITPYGTETMHVLRAEKGFIIVGQDTDGSMTPYDIDHGWAVRPDKPFSFIGKRGMQRADCLRTDRKQLVGLKTTDPAVVLPEGAQAVQDPDESIPMTMIGHVSSSYYSANLQRSIALAVIKNGLQRKGDRIYFPLADDQVIEAEICSPVFYDPQSLRQKS